jgi:hypothetical protein
VVFFWTRILRDAARRQDELAAARDPANAEPAAPVDEPVAYRRYVMPTTPEPTDDPAITAYNNYLAGLARESARSEE